MTDQHYRYRRVVARDRIELGERAATALDVENGPTISHWWRAYSIASRIYHAQRVASRR